MHIAIPASALIALLLTSARIFAWSLIAPPLATGGLPSTVKTVLSVALGLAMVPSVQAHVPAPETVAVAGSLLEQVLIGAGLGFLTRVLFSAVEAAGSLLDVFGGFSLAAAYNPLTTTTTSIFGGFYGLMCTTLIFATNVHLVIFGGFLNSFQTVPLDASISVNKLGSALTGGVSELFVDALQIAGPLIVVLFIADLSLGVLNRIAPQLNAFSLSFPVKIGLTFLLVGFTFLLMPQTVANLADRATTVIRSVTG